MSDDLTPEAQTDALMTAAQAEVEPPAIAASVEWRGIKVKLTAFRNDLDPDALEALENGKGITGLRALIGSDEYDKVRKEFTTKYGHAPTLVDIAGEDDAETEASKTSLAYVVMEHFGFTGN